MTNEKDREIAGIIRSECFVDISQTERPCFEWDLDIAANVISKYRAEAVKAERERCKMIVTGEILEYDCDFTGLVNSIVSRILSDDLEASNG